MPFREGKEQIRQLKIAKTQQKIDRWLEQKSLNKNQQQKLLANQTSLSLLKTFQGFSRPSKLKPQQNSSLIMGVSIGLQEPVTVAIVNVTNGEIIAFYNTRQLLSKPIQQKPQPGKKAKKHTQYELFLRRRQQQQDNDAKRQHAQTKFADNRFGESELGIYVDRLLAKAIIEMAIQYQVIRNPVLITIFSLRSRGAGEQGSRGGKTNNYMEGLTIGFSISSIVLPDLTNIREILESEITARAEAKIPGCKKAQKLYAKKYRKNIHCWSYARLCDAIKSKAVQKGLAIEYERQIPSGTPKVQARDLSLIAYHHRQKAIS